MWAASVIIATELEKYPPRNSRIMNEKQIAVTIAKLFKAFY
jgi:hypothetical protein